MIEEKEFVDKFSRIVKRYIKEQNISIEEAAFRSKLSYPTVNLLLNGHKRRITAYLMLKLCKGLKIPMKELEKLL